MFPIYRKFIISVVLFVASGCEYESELDRRHVEKRIDFSLVDDLNRSLSRQNTPLSKFVSSVPRQSTVSHVLSTDRWNHDGYEVLVLHSVRKKEILDGDILQNFDEDKYKYSNILDDYCKTDVLNIIYIVKTSNNKLIPGISATTGPLMRIWYDQNPYFQCYFTFPEGRLKTF